MLRRVKVRNFKSFKEELSFDLSEINNFEFNKECIKDNIVNTALIYGENGSGKSNLGFAIFDIVGQLTDKFFPANVYDRYYFYAGCTEERASFEFEFQFGTDRLIYKICEI